MKCLNNLDRISYPQELVIDLTKLYRFKGKDFYYEDILKNEMSQIVKTTIEKDTFYAAKLLDLKVTESRTKLLIRKDSKPKTKDETILTNLKNVFKLVQEKGEDIELTTNEFLQLGKKIFGENGIDYATEIVDYKVNLLTDKKKVSKREKMSEELKLYEKLLYSQTIEPTQIITNIYVDLLHLNVFTNYNEFMSLLIFYCLLYRERFNVFKYISFFQLYYEDKDKFKTATISAGYDWEEGFSQTAPLNRLTIKTMLNAYQQVEGKTEDFKFDKRIRKVDNVEATILRLGEVFTREQIKNAHPTLSDSTINRALEKLKKENKVRSTGTGRAATWVRLVPEEMMSAKMKQMTLFDILMDTDEDE